MASQETLRQVNLALAELSRAAQAEFLAGFEAIDPRLQYQRNQFVREFFPGLIEKYGIITASIGADVFEAEARALGLRPLTEVAPPVNRERASTRLGAELATTTTLSTSLQLVDELVKQPYRSTFQDSAINSGAGWARVPVGDTCNFCIMLGSRGGVYSSKEVAILGFSGKKYHGECVVEGTVISGPSAQVALRREYEGVVVDISTAFGHHATVTPNHPVLTRRGWVAAGALNEGDELLSAGVGEGHVVGGPDVDDSPTLAEDRFRSLSMVGTSVRGVVPGSSEQFHGDGRKGEVEVVARDRFLWDEMEASFRHGSTESDFSNGAFMCPVHGVGLDGLGSSEVLGSSPGGASDGFMGGGGLGLALVGSHFRGAEHSSGRPSPDVDASLHQCATDRAARNSEAVGDSELTLSGKVSGDDTFGQIERSRSVRRDPVTAIVRRSYRGHVYNFRTESSWYFANSIVTHNCDCQPILVRGPEDYPDGYDPDAMYGQYMRARDAVGDYFDTSGILAKMREMYGGH